MKKNKSIGIFGLGYVGRPLYELFKNKDYLVKGYDIDPAKSIHTLSEMKKLKYYIVTVPTPIKNKKPDLSFLEKATRTIKKLNKKAIIIYESTVYPGVTENLSKKFNIKYYGYSPERISPGEKERVKERLISANSKKILKKIDKLYSSIGFNTIKVDIKIAEAAKVLENTQRDLNIALMNEIDLLFRKDNINTKEVIKAASSKWNFYEVYPGLVGGHCIAVDPYYLIDYAKSKKEKLSMVKKARKINNKRIDFIVNKILKHKNKKVLLIGKTYKANVKDTRESGALKIYKKLKNKIKIKNFDVLIDSEKKLKKIKKFKPQIIVILVDHYNSKDKLIKEFKKIEYVLDYSL